MEMADKQFSPFMEMLWAVLEKAVLTAYRNGWQAVLPVYGTTCATAFYCLCNYVLQTL
jgi:hypothetical protein